MSETIRTPDVRGVRFQLPCRGCTRLSFKFRHAAFARYVGLVLSWLLCASVSFGFNTAYAAPAIDRVEIGFDGNYKLGCWTPLTVQVSGLADIQEPELSVIVPDSDGVPTRVRHSIRANAESPQRLYVKIGRNTGEMIVTLRDGEREWARRAFDLSGGGLPAAISSDSWLFLTLGPTNHLAQTLSGYKPLQRSGGRVVTLTQTAALPDQWFGYESVDVVILSGGAPELKQLLEGDRAQQALDSWLRRGGTLLMNLGPNAKPWLSADGPVAQWSPGRFEGLTQLTSAGSLERASGVEALLEPLTGGEPFALPVIRLTQAGGETLVPSGPRREDPPLVIERPYGFGRVVWSAIDLDDPLLGRWQGTAPLVAHWFLPRGQAEDEETPRQLGQVAHAGYDDLAGQFRSALDQFQNQGVRLLPFGALLGLMLIYVVLLGPGDYLLLKRWLRRLELTWITMPLLILLTCVGAYAMAVGMRGREVRMNQVDIVDFDDVQQARRASSYFTVFSPRGQAYDLRLHVDSESPSTTSSVLLSWFGLPGTALGGMESRAAPPLAGRPYDFVKDLSALDEVPIAIWSTKSFVARWAPTGEAPLTATLEPTVGTLEGLLKGSVTNRSSQPLDECLLLTKQWVYPLGTLAAGERLPIHDGLGPRTSESYLTRRRETDEAYDLQGSSLKRIVDVMSFYKKMDGENYVGLKHRYEALLDMSLHLGNDRALLLGLRRHPLATVRNGKQPLAPTATEGLTVYRVIVPIRNP